MKKLYILTLVGGLLLASCAETELVVPDVDDNNHMEIVIPEGAAEGELLIKFAPEMSGILDQIGHEKRATRCGIPSTDEVLSILGTYQLERLFPVDPRHEQRTRDAGLHLWYIVHFDKDTDLKKAVASLQCLGEISNIQCNTSLKIAQHRMRKPVWIESSRLARTSRTMTPCFNDPGLIHQWGYINTGDYDFEQPWAPVVAGADVNCEEAWKLCTGDPSIIVAVLDEGVMWNHPDLAANMWVNDRETLGSDTDADDNGYKGDRYGYNFVTGSSIISWNGLNDNGHGTHVAGTIAAVNGNGQGVCGIAGGRDGQGGVRIMTCQIMDDGRTVLLSNEARAMKYAADNGAVIMQCSWGYNSADANELMGYTPGPKDEKEWGKKYPLEKEAIDYFIHNAGSPNGVIEGGIAIFASGNEYASSSSFPAAYSKCLSVSALAADYTPSSYTNYGTDVDFAAPGGDTEYYGTLGVDNDGMDMTRPNGAVLSTLVVDGVPGYGYYEGSSMACPHVSGVAALGLSYAVQQRRHFKAEEFIALMKETSRDLDQYYTGRKKYHRNYVSPGVSPTWMELSAYRGHMGRLVDAGALLTAVEGAGSPMRVPNFYLSPDENKATDLARIFVKGEMLTYTAEGADASIAEVQVKGSLLTVTGKAEGSTTASVRASDGSQQQITIVVRKGSSDNGWM